MATITLPPSPPTGTSSTNYALALIGIPLVGIAIAIWLTNTKATLLTIAATLLAMTLLLVFSKFLSTTKHSTIVANALLSIVIAVFLAALALNASAVIYERPLRFALWLKEDAAAKRNLLEAKPTDLGPVVYMVFFNWNDFTLSPQAIVTVRMAASSYKAMDGSYTIALVGHSDTSGPELQNMALSLRRANATRAALVSEGVPLEAIAVIGLGETDLLVDTADGVREPQNRRVEVVLIRRSSK